MYTPEEVRRDNLTQIVKTVRCYMSARSLRKKRHRRLDASRVPPLKYVGLAVSALASSCRLLATEAETASEVV